MAYLDAEQIDLLEKQSRSIEEGRLMARSKDEMFFERIIKSTNSGVSKEEFDLIYERVRKNQARIRKTSIHFGAFIEGTSKKMLLKSQDIKKDGIRDIDNAKLEANRYIVPTHFRVTYKVLANNTDETLIVKGRATASAVKTSPELMGSKIVDFSAGDAKIVRDLSFHNLDQTGRTDVLESTHYLDVSNVIKPLQILNFEIEVPAIISVPALTYAYVEVYGVGTVAV